MVEPTDKAREEFFSEAQEIIETLSRNLLALDGSLKEGALDPSLVNEAASKSKPTALRITAMNSLTTAGSLTEGSNTGRGATLPRSGW